MPVLPVSDFWRCSFHKYYKLRWAKQDLISDIIWTTFNIPLIIIAAVLIYFGVLLIPFSKNEQTMNPHLYVIYQSVYTVLSYPCTVQIFEIALPTTLSNRFLRYIILPIPVYVIIVTMYILYSPLVPNINTSQGSAYDRTVGPFILSQYAIVVFSIIIYGKSCYQYFKKPSATDTPLIDDEPNDFDTCVGSDYRNVLYSIQFSKSTQDNTVAQQSTINSLLLYENSDISDDSFFAESTNVSVNNQRIQVIFAALSIAGISGTYYWTQYLTWQWQKPLSVKQDKVTISDRVQEIMLLYPVFWVVINIIKFITQRFARYCDSNKTSRYSLELIVTFFLTCFYYVFYRNLFLHISSYGSFLLIKGAHIMLELTLYVLRMSPWYFEKTDVLQNKLKDGRICCAKLFVLLQPFIMIVYDPSPYYIWCVRISIDYTLQFIVSIGSGIGYIVGVLWLKYGYNQYFYDIKDISKEQFEKTLTFTGIGLGLELMVYFVLDYVMKYAYRVHVMEYWNALIRHRRGYIWYFIFMLQHVLTDVMIAKLLND